MTAKTHNFTIGTIDCTALLDAAVVIGAERALGRFPDLEEADVRQAYGEIGLSLDHAESSMNMLVADMGETRVLVDTGQGEDLLESMKTANITPESINLIVITHVHGDHILGILDADGAAIYPNATYILSKPEMDFWLSRIENGAEAQRPILEMMQSKGLRLIETDEQILPGLTAQPIPGHTPGQIALLLESGDEKLLHLADLLHSPMQFAHPDWSIKFDTDPAQAAATRQTWLQHAAAENLLTFFYHLDFPGLGHIKITDNSFVREAL